MRLNNKNIKLIDEIIQNKSRDLPSADFKKICFSKYPKYKLNYSLNKYLPYALNSRFFSKMALLVLTSFLFQNNSEAVGLRVPSPSTSKIKLLRQTEATTCTDCLNRSPQSSLSEYLSQLPIVKDGFARVHNAAYFDDGNDKQAVVDLRNRKANGETLTTEENAILVAAGRTGKITCKLPSGDEDASNAFLVRIDGRDAIVTSAHGMLDQKTGKPKCDLTKVGYYPNFSFFDKTKGKPTDFDKILVKTDGNLPLNYENISGSARPRLEKDFLIFFLDPKKEISKDKLPDGSVRGHLSFSPTVPKKGPVYLIGTDPGFRKNTATTYQKCDSELLVSDTVSHNCDTLNGVSSSLIGAMENNEIKVVGLHTYGTEETLPGNSPSYDWNGANSALNILKYLKEQNLSY